MSEKLAWFVQNEVSTDRLILYNSHILHICEVDVFVEILIVSQSNTPNFTYITML